jgi:hypothetical protein
MMWMLSIIIGNSVKIQVKTGWVESGILWMAIVGRPGVGKTPNINNIIFPLQKANNNEIKTYIKRMDAYRVYMEMDKKEREGEEQLRKPTKTQFIASDITLEALVELHEENKNAVGVFKDELAGWLKDMNKYRAGSDLEFWLSSWSNKGVALNRKTSKSSFVESPVIPILGGIQPGILNQFFTEENKDNGFLDRLLVSYPDKEIEHYNKNSIDQEILDWYEAYISQFYNLVRNQVLQYNKFGEIDSKIVRFDSQADIEWERIFNNITDLQNSDDISEYVKSMLSKQKAYVPRFALLINTLWAFETGNNIDFVNKDSLLKAEKLSNYFIAMSKKIKLSSLESNELSEIIRSMKNESIEKKIEMINKTIPDFNRSELAELLNVSRTTIYKHLKK